MIKHTKYYNLATLVIFLLLLLAGSACAGSDDDVYRQQVVEDLKLEIKRDILEINRYPYSYGDNKKSYFRVGSGSLLDLEPVGPSVGDVVGA